jgi:hypothetical protein
MVGASPLLPCRLSEKVAPRTEETAPRARLNSNPSGARDPGTDSRSRWTHGRLEPVRAWL